MSKAASVTTADFQTEVLDSGIPVLVDFWAPWCPPCRAIGPEIDAVAESMVGKAKILKLDVDQEPDVEARYGVKTIPTLIIFKDGQPVDQINGAVSRSVITRKLNEYL
jgi:thioredoxin 1